MTIKDSKLCSCMMHGHVYLTLGRAKLINNDDYTDILVTKRKILDHKDREIMMEPDSYSWNVAWISNKTQFEA